MPRPAEMDPLMEKFLLSGVASLISAVGVNTITAFQTTQLSLSDLEREMVALRLNTSHTLSDLEKEMVALDKKIDKNHAEMDKKIDTVLAVVKAKGRPWFR